ncbi:MAG: hypothetical protein AB1772_00015 [Candidatus Zixiibacteriota bacterium]
MRLIRLGFLALVAFSLVVASLSGPVAKADGGGGILPPGEEDSTDMVVQDPDSTGSAPDTTEESTQTSFWYWILMVIM